MFTVTVNHPLYRDTPDMQAYTARDLAELKDELRASGVKDRQISVRRSETPFKTAYENGGVFMLDEFDSL